MQAAYSYAPYSAGSPGFAIYYPALAAGYAAALATIQQHSPGGTADAGVQATAAAAAAAAAQQQAAAALALMPTLLAQPVLVPAVQPQGGMGAAQQQQQQQNGHPQWAVPLAAAPWGGAQLYPQFHPHPLHQPLGVPAAAAHLHAAGGGHAQPPAAQLRQRRRGQLPEPVAALLRQQERQLGQLPPPFAALLRRHEAVAGRRDGRAAGGGGRLPAGFQFRLRINMRALLQLLVLLVILYQARLHTRGRGLENSALCWQQGQGQVRAAAHRPRCWPHPSPQHCPPRRFLMLVGLGLLLYLTATEPVRRLLHRLTGMHQQPAPPPQQPAAAPGGQQEQAGDGGGPGAAEAARGAGPGPAAPPPAAAPAAAQAAQPDLGAGAPGQQQPPQQGGGLLQELRAFVVGFITSLLPGYNGERRRRCLGALTGFWKVGGKPIRQRRLTVTLTMVEERDLNLESALLPPLEQSTLRTRQPLRRRRR